MNRAGLVFLFIAGASLGSCDNSKAYRLLAVQVNGHLAFVVDPASEYQETCFNDIDVSAIKGEQARATPKPGDDAQAVAAGTFWQQSFQPQCENGFPIFYGEALKGSPMIYTGDVPGTRAGEPSSVVAAKPLHVGTVYEVDTVSGTLRFGHGWFRITPGRHIENWADNPVSAVLNSEGYDVSGPYKPPPSPPGSVR